MDDLVKQLMHATVSIDGDFDVGCNIRDAAVERLERYGWQPIETAPKDGTWVLTTATGWNGDCEVLGFHFGQWVCGADPVGYPHSPSHWMPLPPPPKS